MSVGRHVAASVVTALGAGSVMLLVATLNRPSPPARPEVARARELVAVAPPQAPKRPERVEQPPPPRPRAESSRPRPPAPTLSSALGGVPLGMPDIAPTAMSGVGDSLLDAAAPVESLVMTESAVDQAPKPLSRSAPDYPARARAKGLTGQVTVRLLVGESGAVLKALVVDSSPAGTFEQAALEAVRRWRFRPGTYRGEAVRVWVRQTLRFDLS